MSGNFYNLAPLQSIPAGQNFANLSDLDDRLNRHSMLVRATQTGIVKLVLSFDFYNGTFRATVARYLSSTTLVLSTRYPGWTEMEWTGSVLTVRS